MKQEYQTYLICASIIIGAIIIGMNIINGLQDLGLQLDYAISKLIENLPQ